MKCFDYFCWNCNDSFEAFVKHEDDEVTCETCEAKGVNRLPAAPKPLYLKMGTDPQSTSADRWADMREQKIRIDSKHIDPEE